MLFGNSVYSFYIFAGASTADILSVYSVILSKTSSVIFNNLSFPNSASISYSQYWSILLSMDYATSVLYLPMIDLSIIPVV